MFNEGIELRAVIASLSGKRSAALFTLNFIKIKLAVPSILLALPVLNQIY
jgi:hypothetical protein